MPEAYDVEEVALQQLETALRLWQDEYDSISAITLAGAAEELLGKLLEEEGRTNALEDLKAGASAIYGALYADEIHAKEFVKRANKARDHLKHYTPGQYREISRMDLEQHAVDMLDRAITNYWRLRERLSTRMRGFVNAQEAARKDDEGTTR